MLQASDTVCPTLFARLHSKNMRTQQLELSLAQVSQLSSRGSRRSPRAGWWFGQMRQIVDGAPDWIPLDEPPCGPEIPELNQRPSSVRLLGRPARFHTS